MIRNRRLNESYSDIDQNNVWDAYDIAETSLGSEELALSLAKAMGEDALVDNLRYIFRTQDIPFMVDEDEYYDEYDDEEEFEESVSRRIPRSSQRVSRPVSRKYGESLRRRKNRR